MISYGFWGGGLRHNDLGWGEPEDEVGRSKAKNDGKEHSNIVGHYCQHAHIWAPQSEHEEKSLSTAHASHLFELFSDFERDLLVQLVLCDR